MFLLLTITPAWLSLSRDERRAAVAEHVAPLLAKHRATTSVRWYDAEAFSANPTDLAVIDTTSLQDWYDLYEGLRDSPLWTVPYFRTEQVILAVEQGFRDYEQRVG